MNQLALHLRQRRRGFTLVELIVVVLILGILAAIAVVGFATVTDRASASAARANLKQFATSVLAQSTVQGDPNLNRTELVGLLNADSSVNVVDGLAADAPWTLVGPKATPGVGEIAVGFDNGNGTAVDANEGARVAMVVVAAGKVFSEVVDLGVGSASPVVEEREAKTPEAVLGGAVAPEVPVVAPPAGVGTVNVSMVSYTTARLNWTPAAGATSYVVSDLTAGTSRTVTGVDADVTGTSGVTSRFQVAAVNAGGTGPASVADVAFTPTEPSLAALTYNTTATGCVDPTIVVPAAGTRTGTINWGDGTTAPLTNYPSHTYASAGTYQVTIDGPFLSFGTSDPASGRADSPCLVSVDAWDNTGTVSMAYAFVDAKNLVAVPADMDTSKVTTMASMFSGASSFNQPLRLDTANVTDFSNMFNLASKFNQTLSFSDTSKVTTMSRMFNAATVFNQPVNFNTASVTTFSNMFNLAKAFNQPVAFDTANATAMDRMFYSDLAFNQPIEFNTANVTTMGGMFGKATAFNQALTLDTSKVKNMNQMFYGTTVFNKPVNFNTASVTDFGSMFWDAKAFNQPVSFNTASATDLSNMFAGASAFNQPLTFTDTSHVTNMVGMFDSAYAFNQPVNFNTSNVTSMSSMFSNARAFNQTVAFDTSKVTSTSFMFYDTWVFNKPVNFNTSNVTDMSSMFYSADVFNQPLNFDISKVEFMGSMLAMNPKFNQDLSGWDTSNVRTYSGFGSNMPAWSLSYRPTFS